MRKYALITGCALLLNCSSDNVSRTEHDSNLKGGNKESFSLQESKVKPVTDPFALPPDFNSAFRPALPPVNVNSLSTPQVRKLYDDLMIWDQQYRDSLHAPGVDYHSDKAWQFTKDYKRADSLNQLTLSALLYKYGWPTVAEYGDRSVEAAFHVTWHADHAYRKLQLPLLQKASGSDTLNMHYYKILKDRILIGDGNKQQFNTHHPLPNGSYQVNF